MLVSYNHIEMSSILAPISPGWKALHDELLATVPELAGIVQKFDKLNWEKKVEFIKPVKSDGLAQSLAFFLEIHAAQAIENWPISMVGGACEVSPGDATHCCVDTQDECKNNVNQDPDQAQILDDIQGWSTESTTRSVLIDEDAIDITNQGDSVYITDSVPHNKEELPQLGAESAEKHMPNDIDDDDFDYNGNVIPKGFVLRGSGYIADNTSPPDAAGIIFNALIGKAVVSSKAIPCDHDLGQIDRENQSLVQGSFNNKNALVKEAVAEQNNMTIGLPDLYGENTGKTEAVANSRFKHEGNDTAWVKAELDDLTITLPDISALNGAAECEIDNAFDPSLVVSTDSLDSIDPMSTIALLVSQSEPGLDAVLANFEQQQQVGATSSVVPSPDKESDGFEATSADTYAAFVQWDFLLLMASEVGPNRASSMATCSANLVVAGGDSHPPAFQVWWQG